MSLRVGLIVPGFSAGEQDWCIPALLNYVRALARRADVEVFALRYPHRRSTYQIGNASVHSFGYAARRGAASLALWREVVRGVEQRHRVRPFDVLHAFWADEPAWIAASAAGRMQVPLVVSLAGGELAAQPQIGYGLWGKPPVRLLMRRALARADAITAGSTYLRELAEARGLACVQCAPLGVDAALFRPPSPARRPGSSLELLNVGSLAPVKNQVLLVWAMQEVVRQAPGTHLQVIGDGEMKGALQGEIERLGLGGNVRVQAALRHEELVDVYRAADLFVQSSLHEAQGMAVLEAAACGVPGVGTAVGVLREMAPEAARTAEADIDALAGAIIDLAKQPERREQMGRAARARVEACYSVEPCVERFVGLYESARESRKAGVVARSRKRDSSLRSE